ncbi:probable phosphoglycerate mutase [Aliiroseovarius sediminilitoris]|uniref:Probable phosphoglycerate mutase n=1 Tax=Aliiroseovarius sediminilitoris TaxID=1173584 RepID=A0A1I0Q436_9RHOB|nr:histidine phosphatase family protein [Aliiroseovarius sediminilitoris]SEW21544.1 probable phosphoglycerate mutase [Aliiroseovarius sediminilitoris]
MTKLYPEIFVIRHGQTEWNLARRQQGRLDSPLTELGCQQARDMGEMLQRVVGEREDIKAFSSPQGRALQTAALSLAPFGWPVTEDARLCEVAFGAWEGLTQARIKAGWPALAAMSEEDPINWHFRSPGGERYRDLELRADAFLGDLAGPAVIFTHGILSRVLRTRWMGLTADDMLDLPGGQGIIFHLSPRHGHRTIEK